MQKKKYFYLVKKTIVLKIVLFFSSNKVIPFNFKNTGFINYDIILEGTLSKIKKKINLNWQNFEAITR